MARSRKEDTKTKAERLQTILRLVQEHRISRQEVLLEHLRNEGFEVTQATVSRDIKELRLIKILSAETGKYKYAVASSEVENSFTNRLKNIFKECVTDISAAQNMVVIKTLPGLGQAAAMAIDAMRNKSVVGTLGGDDTVFIVMRDADAAEKFCSEARTMLV